MFCTTVTFAAVLAPLADLVLTADAKAFGYALTSIALDKIFLERANSLSKPIV